VVVLVLTSDRNGAGKRGEESGRGAFLAGRGGAGRVTDAKRRGEAGVS